MECAGEHSRVRTQPDVCGGMRRRFHLGGDFFVPAITGARARRGCGVRRAGACFDFFII